MRVIGTAGHVDHGKSTLIKALTGIDPDRLKEEKEREMTIDLGFAWFNLPSGEQVGVIDVPGHQDFIKNMLAGVGGIDAALLVIAADESVMPQTQEHLAILDLLKVPAGVIALTKVDLVDGPEWLELVEAEVMEAVENTALQDAPIVPVSAVTGQGLDQLSQTLDQVLALAVQHVDRGRPRLPIDRVFTVAGFGTIVTGTLLNGSLAVGQEVEVLPNGVRTRIRGLQTHKTKIETALPGSRVAVNLTGIGTEEIQRGNVITLPGWLEPTQLPDVRLEHLSNSPQEIRHNQEVEFYSGSAEVMARVRLLGTRTLPPGQSSWAQLRLAQPVPLVKGDRFIIRQPSPSRTIGGGFVVDPLPRRRHRRFREDVIQRLETLAHGTPGDLIVEMLDRRGPLPARNLVEELPLPAATACQNLSELMANGEVFVVAPSQGIPSSPESSSIYVASRGAWAGLLSRLTNETNRFHQEKPLRQGIPREALKSRLKLETRLFNDMLARALVENAVAEHEGLIHLPEHTVRFSTEQEQAVESILNQFRKAPFTTPSYKEVIGSLGGEVLLSLIESHQMLRISSDVLLLPETYQDLLSWIRQTIAEQGSVNVAQLRDAFNTSRKYALAMLEHTDEQRITKRVGDDRVLR